MPTRRATLLAGLALPLAARAARAAGIQVRISTAAPPGDFLSKSLEQMKAAVAAANLGIDISVHPASTLFKQGTEVPALQRGTLEMSTMTTFEVAQQIPALGFLNRAYLFADHAHMRRVFDGPIGADYRAMVAERMGIEILSTAYLGTRQVALRTRRAIAGPADFAGTKLRMPGGPDWQLLGQVLGVNPVPMGMPELYLAMKTGTVDGEENPLTIFNAAKLYEVSQQVVLTAHMLQPVFFAIAKPVLDRMSPAQRQAMAAAAQDAAKANDTARLADEQHVAGAVKARGLAVDAPDLAPFRANATRVYAAAAEAKRWDAAMAARVAAA